MKILIKISKYLYNIIRLYILSKESRISFSETNTNIDVVETLVALKKVDQNICILWEVGAFDGKWGNLACKVFPSIREIHLFEPQLNNFLLLQSQSYGKAKPSFYNFALGNKNANSYLIGNTASASLLQPTKYQNMYFPNSIPTKKKFQIIVKKGDYVKQKFNLKLPDVIKIDVQGYELSVLQGMQHVISHAKYIIIEISYRKYYKTQPSISELFNFLELNHYEVVSRGYEWWFNKNGREILQTDLIFRRKYV